MKIELDVRSAALGAAAGALLPLAAGASALPPFWPAATALAMGGLAYATLAFGAANAHTKAAPVAAHLRHEPPYAMPSMSFGPPVKTPQEWVEALSRDADVPRSGPARADRLYGLIVAALEEQVRAPHDPEIVEAVLDALRLAGCQTATDRLWGIQDLAIRAQHGRPDLNGFHDACLERGAPPANGDEARHHFPSGRVLRALEEARRTGGLVPPVEFLWLKGIDRRLWYTVASIGRRSYYVEAAGPVCHYLGERALGRALPKPWVANAAEGVMVALGEPMPAREEPSPRLGVQTRPGLPAADLMREAAEAGRDAEAAGSA